MPWLLFAPVPNVAVSDRQQGPADRKPLAIDHSSSGGSSPLQTQGDVVELDAVDVVARRGAAAIAPEIEFDATAIDDFGGYDIGELVGRASTALGLGAAPVLIVNGRRIASPRDILAFPPDALVRLEVLPAEASSLYGGDPSRRVLNLVLQQRFRSRDGLIAASRPSAGGRSTIQGDVRRSTIDGDDTGQFRASGIARDVSARRRKVDRQRRPRSRAWRHLASGECRTGRQPVDQPRPGGLVRLPRSERSASVGSRRSGDGRGARTRAKPSRHRLSCRRPQRRVNGLACSVRDHPQRRTSATDRPCRPTVGKPFHHGDPERRPSPVPAPRRPGPHGRVGANPAVLGRDTRWTFRPQVDQRPDVRPARQPVSAALEPVRGHEGIPSPTLGDDDPDCRRFAAPGGRLWRRARRRPRHCLVA